MYLKKIYLENVWPIEKLDFELPFNWYNPKPLILVWENWTGKSIFLSFIVNALVSARQSIWIENTEVETWKVYKYRSPSYIKSKKIYYSANLLFDEWLEYNELQLLKKKFDLSDDEKSIISIKNWFSKMEDKEASIFDTNFSSKLKEIQKSDNEKIILYYPANRFEEPAWLNINNLNSKIEYQDYYNTSNKTNRNIIIFNNLKFIQNWLFDLVYDDLLNRKVEKKSIINNWKIELWDVLESINTSSYYNDILTILLVIFSFKSYKNLRFIFWNRQNRTLSLFEWDKEICPNIFNLSTWETLLINLFFSIIRDYDLTKNWYKKLEDISWIVIIDEVDLHLHSNLQKEILPKLIKLFPKIQFILTTHSPLFVLWMEEEFWVDWIEIREMPNWDVITAERFKEFENAFEYYSKTKKFDEEIKEKLNDLWKIDEVTIISEWNNSIFFNKAKDFFDKDWNYNFFEQKEFWDKEIEKLFKFLLKTQNTAPKKIFILDCDSQKIFNNLDEIKTDFLVPLIIPKNSDNKKIKKWIENIFSKELFTDDCYIKKEITDDYWGTTTSSKFDKRIFEKKVLDRNNIDDFKNFWDIFKNIKEII